MPYHLQILNTSMEPISYLDFGSINAGEKSSELSIIIANDLNREYNSEDASGVVVKITNADGTETGAPIEQGWFQYKIGSPDDTARPLIITQRWRPLARGYSINLGPIQAGTYRTLTLRVNAPPYAATSSVSVALSIGFGAYFAPISPIEYEFSDDGVVNEEDSAGAEIRSGFDLSVANRDITVSSGEAIFDGLLYVIDGDTITINDRDANNEQIVDNELYQAVLSVTKDGFVLTKTSKRTSLGEWPSAEGVELARIISYLNSISVTDTREFCEFGLRIYTAGSASYVQIGHGRGVIEHSYIESPGATFALSSMLIFATVDGYIGVAQENGEIEGLPLYRITMSNGSVLVYDYRHYIGSSTRVARGDVLQYHALVYSGLEVRHASSSDSTNLFAGIAEHDSINGTVHVITDGLAKAVVSGTVNAGDILTFGDNGVLVPGSSGVAVALKQISDSVWYVKLKP